MNPYVFIGFSANFGDYADIVHACGGYIRKIVVNMPRDMPLGVLTFDQRLERYEALLRSSGGPGKVEVQELRDFRPDPADLHVMAARGLRLQPLQRHLTDTLRIRLEPLVHPSAIISPTVELPEGIIILPRVTIGSETVPGLHSCLSTGAYVAHDCQLGAYVQIGPRANLASGTVVEKGAVIGMGATVINGCTVGEEAFVAAGAVVTKDVARFTMVAGVPAVPRKKLERCQVPETVPGLER